jgi:hypothetical protein
LFSRVFGLFLFLCLLEGIGQIAVIFPIFAHFSPFFVAEFVADSGIKKGTPLGAFCAYIAK